MSEPVPAPVPAPVRDPVPAPARPPRAAATLVVLRDTPAGIEVLLSRRAERGDHNNGAWVFPGGVVDAGDRAAHACCVGLDDAAASARLGVPSGGLDYFVAAIRECFEEAGLLFAADAHDRLVALDDAAAGTALGAWRGALHRLERSLGDLCAYAGVNLAVDRLVYLSHWLTPLGRAKRFDTRFFIAAVPLAQTAAFDGTELVEQLWLRPVDALARRAELKLMTPTQKTLEQIEHFPTVGAALRWAAEPRTVPMTVPRVGFGADGMRPVMPDEPAYAEMGRIDPTGIGTASYDIRPGVAVRLSPRLIRVTAGNGSMMTGPGTNTYLVGSGVDADPWAVIDPGPADDAHLEAVLAAAPGPIRWIFVTHTHHDHSPLALPLQARTGATLHGRVADHPEWQDPTFVPEVALRGGERVALGPADGSATTHLRAIHTPGHASNHLCFLLEEERLLFTGDHVMQASTVVINPPDGDMAAYLASLRQLEDEDLAWLAPGHGFLMADPARALRAIVQHREKREAKVVAALRALGAADESALLAQVYADVPPRLHPMALRSLRAHLLKLRDEARAGLHGDRWSLHETAGNASVA